MFVDIYAIHTVPPSNINRDDTGSPKTALYGGVLRARVSSQAWKRAMRLDMPAYLPEGSFGVRTKLAAELIAKKICEKRSDLADIADGLAQAALGALGIKVEASTRAGEDEGKTATKYLVFIAPGELDAMSDIAIRWADTGKDWKKLAAVAEQSKKKPDAASKKEMLGAFHGARAVDIALFGRMLADALELNTDACAQVAHAISVDRVTQEYDYFAAMDDCASRDNNGAAMLDTVGFNSSTLYRYATVNVDALKQQLGSAEAAARGVEAFIQTFVRSMPTGKQNTFANRTLPSAVLVSLRDEQPLNAVAAFERPVVATADEPVARIAARRLGTQVDAFQKAYGMPAKQAWNTVVGCPVEELNAVSEPVGFDELVRLVHDAVLEPVDGGE